MPPSYLFSASFSRFCPSILLCLCSTDLFQYQVFARQRLANLQKENARREILALSGLEKQTRLKQTDFRQYYRLEDVLYVQKKWKNFKLSIYGRRKIAIPSFSAGSFIELPS